MSQQINLLIPELRPKRDWLAFPAVAGMALSGLALLVIVAAWGYYQIQVLAAAQASSGAEVKSLQQQVQSLSQILASRKPSPALQAETDRLKELLQQRDAVMAVVEAGKLNPGSGYAAVMRGFARQVSEGVWLTGFTFSGQDAEIRGRLADPALLPQYIRRLNGEEVFQGRRFAALDMKDGLSGTATVPGPRYTEFLLRGNPVVQEGGKP